MKDFCPRCGTARIGAFRFCRSCQFDFDTLTAADAQPLAPIANELEQATAAPAALTEPVTIPPPPLAAATAAEPVPAWGVPAERVDGQTTLRPASRTFRMSKRTMVVAGIAILLAIGAIGATGKDQDPAPVAAGSSSPTLRPAVRPTKKPVAVASPLAATPVPTVAPTPAPTLAPTPEATPEPTERRRTFKQMVDSATKVSYDELFRNSDKYLLDAVYFKGEVIQVLDDGAGSYTLRVNVTKGEYGFWDDTVLLIYEGDRVLVDDIVEFVGISTGPYTYESVLGGDITIPAIDVTVDNQSALQVIG